MKKRGLALDPRLLIGIGLVVVSVAGVWAIVTTADETAAVYAASAALTPGDAIRAGDLEIRRVRLDAAANYYLAPGDIPSNGLVATRVVGAGELVPLSATGSTAGVTATSVVLDLEGQLPEAIDAGSVIDVWASRAGENGTFGEPKAIVSGATVVRLVESPAMVGAGETTAVEVLVARSRLARVLAAIANDDAIAIVPATLPGGR